MPPEENKTQDVPQQDDAQAKPANVETPTPIEPLVESAPAIEQEEVSETAPAEQAQGETPVIESPVEPIVEQVETPKTEETQTTQEPPQPQIQERIIYKTDPNIVQKLLVKARAKIQERKQKKLDKIMTLFEAKPQITNKDIQKLLRISRVSAFRYFNILEKQNRIKQVGNTGKSVFYTKI